MSFQSTLNFSTSHFVTNAHTTTMNLPFQFSLYIFYLWFITLSYPYCYFLPDNLEMSKTKTKTDSNWFAHKQNQNHFKLNFLLTTKPEPKWTSHEEQNQNQLCAPSLSKTRTITKKTFCSPALVASDLQDTTILLCHFAVFKCNPTIAKQHPPTFSTNIGTSFCDDSTGDIAFSSFHRSDFHPTHHGCAPSPDC